MAKKIERVFRDRQLTPAEAARDADVRRQVESEFPPASASNHGAPPSNPGQATRMSLSNLLRVAIRNSGKSLETIAHDAGLSEALIAKFVSGDRDIRVTTAEKLAESVGLNLTAS